MPYRTRRYVRRPYRKRRFNRRWFVEGNLGQHVPILGGSNFRLGTRNVKKVARNQALKMSETKEHVRKITSTTLLHNTLHTTNLVFIGQGTTGASRVGENVFICGFNLKMEIRQSIPNSIWRMFIVKSRERFLSATDSQNNSTIYGSGFGSSDFFRGNDTTPTSLVNHDNMNIIAYRTVKVDAKYTGENPILREVKWNVRIMSKHQMAANYYGAQYNYYLVVLPYSQNPTAVTGTDVVGGLTTTIEQVYKDA